MNTQTHVLLAVSVVGCLAGAVTAKFSATPTSPPILTLSQYWTVSLIVFGALLPDISLFVMFAYAQLTGVPNDVIWSTMYYSDFWQNLGAITNSAPIYLCGSLICAGIIYRSIPRLTVKAKPSPDKQKPHSVLLNLVFAFWVMSVAALLHVAADLPLHHDDGHPHFWPFTHWIYASPVSYWDAAHYASIWVPIECILGLTFVAILWKKTKRIGNKALLILAGLSYPLFAFFFFS